MRCLFVVAVLLAAIPALLTAQSPKLIHEPTPAERLQAIKDAKLSFDDALEAVKDYVVSGLVFRIELSVEESKPVYRAQMIIGNPTHHLTINAMDGTLVSQRDDGRLNKYGTIYRIRLGEEENIGLIHAIQLAESDFPEFRAYSTEAVVLGNMIVFEVRMLSPMEELHVRYSPVGVRISAGPPPPSLGK